MTLTDILSPLLLLAAAIMCSLAAVIAWQRKPAAGAITLTIMLLSVGGWSLANMMLNLAHAREEILLLRNLGITGQIISATLFLVFVIEYTQQDSLFARRKILILWVIPLVSIFLAFSNETHHTFWLNTAPGRGSNGYDLLPPGPAYWITIIYYYLMRLSATIILVRAILRYPATYSIHSAHLLMGAIATWLPEIVLLAPLASLNSRTWENILHPVAYASSGLIITWGIFRHRLIDLVPIVRDIIIENIRDGIIVLDNQRRVVDINMAARNLLQIDEKSNILGATLEEALHKLPDAKKLLSNSDMPFQDIYLPHPADLTLEVMSSPIVDRHGQFRGTMLNFHDISMRVRSEMGMRQSEENLRNVFENAPFPITVATPDDGLILYINPAGVKLYKLEGQNIQNLRTSDFYLDENIHTKLVQAIKETDHIDNVEVRLRTADHKSLWMATSLRKINYNGKNAVLITQIDVSQQHHGLEELHQSRAQLRNIFEHADAGIYLLNVSGGITFSNERWAGLLGQSASQLADKSLSDFIFKSDVPYSRHLFESLIAGEIEKYSLELRYQRSNGSIFWGSLSAIPVFGPNNEIESIVNFVSDITEKKETEKALRETERRFREILEKIYLFAVMLDTQGNITFCNDYLLKQTGWQASEIYDENWFEVFLAKNSNETLTEYKRAISQNRLVSRHENEILTADGKRLLVAWSNILLRDASGEIIGSASIGEDITERRRAQQAEIEQRLFAEALYDTAATITSTLNFEEVLDRILENLDAAVETDSANISLIEAGKVRFVRAKGYEKQGIANEDILKLEFTIKSIRNLREMYQSKEPICIPDTSKYPSWKHTKTSQWMRSYIGVPIVVKDKVVGFINVDSATPGYYTQAHAERLKAFSVQAAIAIENTRLYTKSQHELEERKRAQARLRRANHKLNSQLEKIKALQTQLREQAIRDGLTGLFNRRHLEEILPNKISEAWQRKSHLSLMMIDIDHFKNVNDQYGHQVGDQMLKHLGQSFEEHLAGKGIACRYGGEEFAIIMPGISLEEACLFGEILRMHFSQYRLQKAENTVQATISVGVASLYLHGEDGHSLLTAADNALYTAKETGRNRVVIAKKSV